MWLLVTPTHYARKKKGFSVCPKKVEVNPSPPSQRPNHLCSLPDPTLLGPFVPFSSSTTLLLKKTLLPFRNGHCSLMRTSKQWIGWRQLPAESGGGGRAESISARAVLPMA